MNTLQTIMALIIFISVSLPLTGVIFRIVRKAVQILAVPTFWGCIVLVEGFNIGEFRIGEKTSKRYPQETLATIHFLTTCMIIYIWFLSMESNETFNLFNNGLILFYILNIASLVGVLIISKFSRPSKNKKDWIDKLLDHKIPLDFYKKMTE